MFDGIITEDTIDSNLTYKHNNDVKDVFTKLNLNFRIIAVVKQIF